MGAGSPPPRSPDRGGSLLRGMPAGHHPASACPYEVLVVESKGNDRGTPAGSLPDDQGAIFAPTKVLVPALTAWVEKGYLLIALRVGALCLRPLVPVAQRASQPQVFFCGRAASSLGNDVLHVHRHGSVCLRGQAVATSVAGRGSDFLSQGLANVRARHGPPQFSCVGTR